MISRAGREIWATFVGLGALVVGGVLLMAASEFLKHVVGIEDRMTQAFVAIIAGIVFWISREIGRALQRHAEVGRKAESTGPVAEAEGPKIRIDDGTFAEKEAIVREVMEKKGYLVGRAQPTQDGGVFFPMRERQEEEETLMPGQGILAKKIAERICQQQRDRLQSEACVCAVRDGIACPRCNPGELDEGAMVTLVLKELQKEPESRGATMLYLRNLTTKGRHLIGDLMADAIEFALDKIQGLEGLVRAAGDENKELSKKYLEVAEYVGTYNEGSPNFEHDQLMFDLKNVNVPFADNIGAEADDPTRR